MIILAYKVLLSLKHKENVRFIVAIKFLINYYIIIWKKIVEWTVISCSRVI